MGRKPRNSKLHTRLWNNKNNNSSTEIPNGYTITFDTNGGTSTEELQQIQTTSI